MQADFWHDRWERNQIGFHLEQVNPHLARYWPDLGLEPGTRVLVPLCGKTLDLTWLAAQGYEVLGVELSEPAVQAFFSEHDLDPKVSQRGGFRVSEAGPVTLLCGDFFALSAEEVAACSGVADATCGAAASAAAGTGTPRVRASCACSRADGGGDCCSAPAYAPADSSIAGNNQRAPLLCACVWTARWRAACFIEDDRSLLRCAGRARSRHLWRARRAQPYAVGAMPLERRFRLDGRKRRGIS